MMGIISYLITPLLTDTYPQVLSLLLGIATYYALVNWGDTPIRLDWLQYGFVAIPLVVAAVGIIGVGSSFQNLNKLPFIPPGFYHILPVVLTDSINPNVLAGTLAFLFPFPLCILLFPFKQKKWTIHLFAGIVVIILLIVGIITQSRNSILGLGLALTIAYLLRWPSRWYLLLLLPLIGCTILWLFGDNPRLFYYWFLMRGGLVTTLNQRMDIWARAVYMIQDFPFTGIGMGNFSKLADTLYPFSIEARNIPHAHNLFLQIAVDLGIPGLIAWLAAWLGIIHISWRIYRGSHPFKALGAALFISQIVLGSVGLLDSVVWGGTKTAPLVWIVWGVAVAAWRITSQTEIKSTPFLEMAGSSEPVDQMPGEEVVPNAITLEGGN